MSEKNFDEARTRYFTDVDDLMRDVGFRPSTPIEVGIARFIEWYRAYHGV